MWKKHIQWYECTECPTTVFYDPHKYTPGRGALCRRCKQRKLGKPLGITFENKRGKRPKGNRSFTALDRDGNVIEVNRREARQGIVAKSEWADVNEPLPRKKKEVM